jgi:hypothetical protein
MQGTDRGRGGAALAYMGGGEQKFAVPCANGRNGRLFAFDRRPP